MISAAFDWQKTAVSLRRRGELSDKLFGSVWGDVISSGEQVYALEVSGGSVVDGDGRLMNLSEFRGV